MKTLPKPLAEKEPEDIFEECVNGYMDVSKRKKLLTCKKIIQMDSESYDLLIPNSIDKFAQSSLPEGIVKENLIDVYKEKFALKNGPGRKYYNQIINSVFRGVCPICGIRIVSTLDHYLPKSKFPSLSVTPSNLIPSCRDCNMEKLSKTSLNPSEVPIHLYFDNIPREPLMFVKLGDNLEALYYIKCPESYNSDFKNRIEKHLDFYNLYSLYSSHAAEEIADEIDLWKDLLNKAGIEELKNHIKFKKDSVEKNDINSWKSALYRGLLLDFDKVLKYLENN